MRGVAPTAALCGRLVVLLTFLSTSHADSQEIPRLRLPPPDAVAEVGFTRVTSIRELADGTVLVADGSEERVSLVDWQGSDARLVGARGYGPGEYRGVGWLHAMTGDSTLLTDTQDRRWLLFEGGRIVETIRQLPFDNIRARDVLGTDAAGRVLGLLAPAHGGAAARVTADTLLLVLADRRSSAVDTIARVRGMSSESTLVRPANERPMLVGGNPLASHDQALLFLDGWLAVARVDGYRVDWRRPDGSWIEGPTLPNDATDVDEAEKCAWMRRWFGSRRPCEPDMLPGWPTAIPPFLPMVTSRATQPLLASPDGGLLVLRALPARSTEVRYDIIDRRGRLTGVLLLDANDALVGFGRQSVYSVSVGEFDLQTLRRHPWPG